MKKNYSLIATLLLVIFYSNAQVPSLQWVQSVGPNTYAYGLQIDATNNLYVNLNPGGPVDIDPGPDVTTVPAGWYDVKYDANGNYKSYKTSVGELADNYIYKNGYTYFTGYFDSTYDFDPGTGVKKINSPYTDFCIAKYSSNNTLLWVDDFISSDANSQLDGGIVIDDNGNCYLSGVIFGNTVDMDPSSNTKLLQGDENGVHNYIAAEYDANGNYKWAFKLDVTDQNEFPFLTYGNNKVFFTGSITGSVDLDPSATTHTVSASSTAEASFLAAYDTNGNYLWGYAYQCDGRVAIEGMQIDSSDNIVIKAFHQDDVNVNFGNGFNNISGNGYFLARYSSDGNCTWGVPITPAGYTSFNPFAMTIDPQNNILLGGADYSADSFNIAVIKYNTNGSEVWNFKLNNYGGTDACQGIVTDHSGNFYISGSFANTVDFDPGSGVNNKTSLGGRDAFFAKYQDNSALPVTLINFSGELNGKQNILHWSTATEENNTGFEIQRSIDGSNFNKIGFINSKAINGNSSANLNYDFIDAGFSSLTNYYRLRQIDKDGKFSYSNIVVLKDNNIAASGLLSVYPNPAKNTLNIKIASPGMSRTALLISDVNGKSLIEKVASIGNSESNVEVDISTLSAGTYFVKLIRTKGYENTVKKFVKN